MMNVAGFSRAMGMVGSASLHGVQAVPKSVRLPIAIGAGAALGVGMFGFGDGDSPTKSGRPGTPTGAAAGAAGGSTLVQDERYEGPLGLRKDGKEMLGYYPAWDGDTFEKRVGGRNHELLQEFVHWSASPAKMQAQTEEKLRSIDKRDGRPVIHLGMDKDGAGTTVEAISPREMARGAGDANLAAVSRAVNETGEYVWMRPYAEMNNSINTYNAYDQDGNPKGGEHSTEAYKDAFRRTAIIMRGGSREEMDAQLKQAGLPALKIDAEELPASGRVSIMWNPHGLSTPDVPGNQPKAYYPGDEYVDMVGGDLYDGGYWDSFEDIYEEFDDKPFVVAEWGAQTDNPQFAKDMFEWVESHDRVKAMLFYDGYSSDDPFNTGNKPKMIDAYRREASGK